MLLRTPYDSKTPLILIIKFPFPSPLIFFYTFFSNFLIGPLKFKIKSKNSFLMNLKEGLVENNNPKFGIKDKEEKDNVIDIRDDEDKEYGFIDSKDYPITSSSLTFHNFWIFFLLFISIFSFYFFLIFTRFHFIPLPSPWILLIFKTFFSSISFIFFLFILILCFPNFISYFIPFYGIFDLLFLFFSSSLNEIFTCILSFIFYIYYLLSPLILSYNFNFYYLKRSCLILYSNFSIFTFIIFSMSLILLLFSFIFMNLILFSTPDRLLLYFLYFLSLYFYISLCTYSLRIFTYNFIIYKNISKSLKNTFYSLGSLSLYSCLDFIILERKISDYLNYLISFLSSIREVSIQTPTYYLFFLIGTQNLPLSEALSQSKNFTLNQNLENNKKRINFLIILIGFVFMHFLNLFYSEILKDSTKNLKEILFLNPHSGNIFTFFVLIFSISFFFSLFMISIYSGVVCLLILENK